MLKRGRGRPRKEIFGTFPYEYSNAITNSTNFTESYRNFNELNRGKLKNRRLSQIMLNLCILLAFDDGYFLTEACLNVY